MVSSGRRRLLANLPTLETERLRVRKARMSDAADMFAYAADPQVANTVTWYAHASIEDSRRFLQYALNTYENPTQHAVWVIEHRETETMIGTIGLRNWHLAHNRAEMGYALSRAYWHRGLMTEAVKAVLHFAFSRLQINRVEATCLPDNTGSSRVMEKVGMQYEGLMRQSMFIKGSYRDLKQYAILRQDWLNAPPPTD